MEKLYKVNLSRKDSKVTVEVRASNMVTVGVVLAKHYPELQNYKVDRVIPA